MLEFSKIGGRYSLERQLYSRGLTKVFLARDERAGHEKVLVEATLFESDQQAARVLEQRRAVVEAVRQLEHPNLASLRQLIVEEPYLCMVKTWEEGVPLPEWLTGSPDASGSSDSPRSSSSPDRPWSMRVSLGRDLLEGLAALHSAGVLHRDVRLRNIWVLTGSERPMAQLDHFLDAVPELLLDRRPVGEPSRWAPEVLRNQEYSRRSDVFAAGLLLFELLREGDSEASSGKLDRGVLGEEALALIKPPYSEVVRRATRPFGVERFDDALDLLAAFDAMDLQRRLMQAGFEE